MKYFWRTSTAKPSEIEAWVLRIIDQQKHNQPCEDSLVEMKSEWLEPKRVARLLAAHANAARGEDILWIIGIDESKGVVGADDKELADWLPAVKACFDGVFPEVVDLNVPVDEKTVVALLFSTDRAPFVVKNITYGRPGSGPVELEVPWREGCSTRSARREDLIRLLVPITRQPSLEVLGATLTIDEPSRASNPSLCNWDMNIKLYIAPSDQNRIVIPCHKCQISITVDQEQVVVNKGISLSPPVYYRRGLQSHVDSITIGSTKSEAIIDGPGRLNVRANLQARKPNKITSSESVLMIRMCCIGDYKPLSVVTNLRRVTEKGRERFLAKWEYEQIIE